MTAEIEKRDRIKNRVKLKIVEIETMEFEECLYLGLNAEAEIQILNSICNLDALALIGVIIAQRSLSPCIFLLI